MLEIEKSGGARIGFMNATWPFAKLKVTQKTLSLKVKMLGNFVFSPEQIVSIEPCGFIPVLWKGIRICHRVPHYNRKIIFWTFDDPKRLVKEIEALGFKV